VKLSRNTSLAALTSATLALPLAAHADGERIAVFTKNQTNRFQIVRSAPTTPPSR
jgi:hypothetical protein